MEKDKIRVFKGGATRDTSNGKFEPLGFIHPYCDYNFCQYMHKHRLQSNGELRDSDNWQSGFGKETLAHSFTRHVEDFKLLHYGFFVYEDRNNGQAVRRVLNEELKELPPNWKQITMTDALNGCRFNSEAYKLEHFKELGIVG